MIALSNFVVNEGSKGETKNSNVQIEVSFDRLNVNFDLNYASDGDKLLESHWKKDRCLKWIQ